MINHYTDTLNYNNFRIGPVFSIFMAFNILP